MIKLETIQKSVTENPILKNRIIMACLLTITVLLVTAAFYVMRPILVPLVFSVFLYIAIVPFIDWCQNRLYLPKFVAVLITFILLILVFTGLITVMGISIKAFIKGSAVYRLKLLNVVDDFTLFVTDYGIKMDLSLVRQALLELPILQWIRSFSGGVFGLAGNSILVFICTMFLLVGKANKDAKGITNRLLTQQISKYLLTKLFTSTLTGILVGMMLALFNVQLALMFAILTFLLNFIPSMGSIIAILIPIPIILFQFGYSMTSLLCIGILCVIQFIIGNIIDPKLMGDSQGLHPAIVLASLLFWGFIWGIPGMFLAVPMTAVIKLLLNLYKPTQPIAAILEGQFK